MTKMLTGGAAAAVLAVGLLAAPARADKVTASPGVLRVHDEAKIFSPEGIRKAESTMSATMFDHGLTMTVDTYKRVPDDRRAEYEQVKGDQAKKAAFMETWAKSLATGDRAKGPYVLICMEAAYVEVLVDEESRNRGFSRDDPKRLATILKDAIAGSAKQADAEKVAARDAGLMRAVEYVVNDLKNTKVQTGHTSPVSTNQPKKSGGIMSGIGGWICIGLCALLVAWLVIGVIRALTGGSGGGGGGYGGGGYGGGGGGGGFFSSLLGGMFGAAAGMYLYNNFFGGHSNFGSSPDAYAGDNYNGGGNYDTGAGNYDGGTSAGAGGDEGGDWGGGGGDTGGGGDWGGGGDAGSGGGDWGDSGGGGGGGDWGGGGGDMGGGGDF